MTVISMIPNDTPFLPPKVTDVPKDVLRNFPHSKKVGNYLLGNTLGEGSFAKVKEALHIPTGERVAVKIIDKKKSREDSYVRKNLRREGKILQMIRHRNVVQLLEIMETQNSYYLVTELCRGGDLMDYISQRRKLPEAEVKKYIRQIVSAVDYLHRLGILHRDLKIENLLLDEYKDMKIIDFGLSNSVKVQQTKDGPKFQEFCVTQCGSPAYAAPELLGRQKYGPQVDVWSIGVNMYAMLTGNLPFTVEPFNIKSLHSKMVNGQMNPLPDHISKDCRDVLKKFLTADPDRRINLEDTLKHPWIADGATSPMPRASCPNKLKTEALENSILKHMSENQGFRVGEIIRYVTGNVPSSATAMYHLMLRKLTKHLGSLKASGKVVGDHRILQRSQNSNNLIKLREDNAQSKNSQPSSDARPLVNHTVNTVRHVVTRTKESESKHENEALDRNDQKESNDENSGLSGAWRRKGKTKHKNGSAETFTDLLHQRPTNEVKFQRSNSPDKHRQDTNHSAQVPNYLPNVAQKYVKRTKTANTDVAQHPRTSSPTHAIANEARKIERLSGAENHDQEDAGQFRKRASTFPGKTQRPVLGANKLREEQTDKTESAATGTGSHQSARARPDGGTASPALEPVTNVKINNLINALGSPKSRRTNNLYRFEVGSSTGSQSHGTTPRTNQQQQQQMFYSRKHQQRRSINVNQLQVSKDREISTNEDEPGGYISKHVLSRPTRNNRIPRASLVAHGGKDEPMIVENLSEFSSTASRPLSSRNTNASGASTHRSITPGLPSLSEGGKRNSHL